MISTDRIALSVVLRIVGGKPFVRHCLSSLKEQIGDHPIEVIVPYDASVNDFSGLKCEFPQFLIVAVVLFVLGVVLKQGNLIQRELWWLQRNQLDLQRNSGRLSPEKEIDSVVARRLARANGLQKRL